jgi:phage shock protein C
MDRLVRKNGEIAGVCGGLADYFDVDPAVMRILFLIFLIFGPGLLVYFILWLAMPSS